MRKANRLGSRVRIREWFWAGVESASLKLKLSEL